jgi:hypothetical protein
MSNKIKEVEKQKDDGRNSEMEMHQRISETKVCSLQGLIELISLWQDD